MGNLERQELTPKQFMDHIPSLSTGQVEQFIEKKRLDNKLKDAETEPADIKPLITFIENLKTLPSMYREPFARKALGGILIEGEPLDLSGIHKVSATTQRNER